MLDDVFLPAHEHVALAQETDPEYLERMALIQNAMAQVQAETPPVPPAWTDAYDAELRDLIDSVSME
jgi:hypothetical protein